MRIAVLSDVHANLEALEAVLDRVASVGADRTWVLGDIVGYGADPQAVIDRLEEAPEALLLAGNHDLAATDRFDLEWFNRHAAEAIRWTVRVLGARGRAVLDRLEPRHDAADTVLVHGSVRDPAAEYLLDAAGAGASFEHEEFTLGFFGHTHVPSVFRRDPGGRVRQSAAGDGEVVEIEDGDRYLLNPGSVGQQRDGDPRASFLLYDTDAHRAEWHRVAYAVESAQGKIRAAGLPEFLADRLAMGR